MRIQTRYTEMLSGTAARLFKEQGIRDPSISEIACAAFNKPLPEHPTTCPDYLGGEIYDGVYKRLKMMRDALDEQGYLVAPIGLNYYKADLRHGTPKPEQVRACLPAGPHRVGEDGTLKDNRPYGIRFVIKGEEDLIYAEYLRSKGTAMASGVSRTGGQIVRANQARALSAENGRNLVGELDARLQNTPRTVQAQLNGPTS